MIEFLKKYQLIIPFVSVVYVTVHFYFLINHGLSYLQNNIILFFVYFAVYPGILDDIYRKINVLIGKRWGLWSAGALIEPEARWGLLALVPIVGVIPITYKICHSLTRLEKYSTIQT